MEILDMVLQINVLMLRKNRLEFKLEKLKPKGNVSIEEVDKYLKKGRLKEIVKEIEQIDIELKRQIEFFTEFLKTNGLDDIEEIVVGKRLIMLDKKDGYIYPEIVERIEIPF